MHHTDIYECEYNIKNKLHDYIIINDSLLYIYIR